MKAILMSIRPQHLVNILNGDKTIELRERFPSDFHGWVYCYCTKGHYSLHKVAFGNKYFLANKELGYLSGINGKVVCRFWVDNVEEVLTLNWDTQTATLDEFNLSLKSCISIKDINNIFGDCKAIHISKLEIFDKPKELGEFYYYKKKWVDCGRDCPPYVDEVKTQVRKAPQSWQYIYIEEEK